METFPSNTQVDWHSLISRYLNIYQRRENKCIRFHGVDYCQISPTYIRIFYPKKSIHPFTRSTFPSDFQLIRVWRVGFSSLHTMRTAQSSYFLIFSGFPVWRLAFSALHQRSPPVWMLWNPNLHTGNLWKSAGNALRVKGWILFSGNRNRIYTRAKWAFPKQNAAFSAR